MKKIIFSLILILVLSKSVFSQEVLVQDIIRKSAVSIFSVGRGVGICSGVLIEDTKVLTAKHCIDTFEEVYVENVSVKSIIASVDDDLALLILSRTIPNKIVTKLAKYNPMIEDNVYHIGYPRFSEYYSEGVINLKTKDHYYAILDIIPGCSGGGVWNKYGELVGIVWGGMQLGEIFSSKTLVVFEPIEDIYKFLRTIQ